ncbi:MAG: V-type ATP synthase subunit E, partial [Chlamydiia bacterium]|nr:V-type ATP synthase subunit E [Chlamydiia bacterium]
KIKQICDVLREETIAPAKEEGQRIVRDAKAEADEIIAKARAEAERLKQEAQKEIQQQQSVAQSSLAQACKQAVQTLRQEVEHRLFNGELNALLESGTSGPMLVAKLVTAMVGAVEREGLSADLSAIVPQSVPAKEVNEVLGESICKKLRGGGVELGRFHGGAKLKLHDKRMTIEITDQALKELLASYVRKDFRQMIFSA